MTSQTSSGSVLVGIVPALFVTSVACAIGSVACAKKSEEAPVGSAVASASSPVPRAPVAAPPAKSDPTRILIPPEAQTSCNAMCERSKQLKCKNTGECLVNCLGMASLTPCTSEISAMFACILKEPNAHWECGEDGVATIRDGYCDKEQSNAVECMDQKMQP